MTGNVPYALSRGAGGGLLENAVRATGPSLLFGLRLWGSVSLALYAAFWLQLDNPYWAATSAAIVCQPQLGASLRKGWFRMLGTLVGAVVSVLLAASFPQDRLMFLGSLALCGAVSAVAATVLRNFASYAAGLAGYTVAIVVGDLVGLTGTVDADKAFLLAVSRASEICLGIACAGLVLAVSDFGTARRRLASLIGAVSSNIASGFIATLGSAGAHLGDTQDDGRELVRRVIALDPIIDQAFGESSELRYHSPVLQRAVDGLYVALGAWRTAAMLLSQLPRERAREAADSVLAQVPTELCAGGNADWIARPVTLRRSADLAAQRLMTMPVDTPALQLLADKLAAAFAGLARALDALALLMADPERLTRRRQGVRRIDIPDWLPAVINGARAFVTITGISLLWIVTAWPSGSQAIVFAFIVSVLMAPHADQAYAASFIAGVGIVFDVVLTAIVTFAVLPGSGVETFVGLSLILAAFLVPIGALLAMARQPWQVGLFAAMTMFFVPLLAPTNPTNYNTLTFYNTALGIVVGAGAGTLAFRLIPPLSPAYQTRRLLDLALHDLRRLLRRRTVTTTEAWDARGFSRLSGLPDSAAPVQRARLLAAILIGAEVIRLGCTVRQLGLGHALDAALASLAEGEVGLATARLTSLDNALAVSRTRTVMKARARILAIRKAVTQHANFFATGAG